MTNQAGRPQSPGNDPHGSSPFQREELIDKPGIIGARWWQESLRAPVARRDALRKIALATAAIVGLGALAAVVGSSCKSPSTSGTGGADVPEGAQAAPRPALDMQREFGWNFGAVAQKLVFDGQSTAPFERTALDRMTQELSPAASEYQSIYVPALFESPPARPRKAPEAESSETAPFSPLAEVLVPISTPAMNAAYARGQALAAAFSAGVPPDLMVIVDLPGPEAVAFAAGAAPAFDPVFGFGNWPHPRGVVPAHLTLAAAAYYQPLFAKIRQARADGKRYPAMIVLDQKRLTPYVDEKTQFDNRYTARMPNDVQLASLAVTRLLYVAPDGTKTELDDINDDLVAASKAGRSTRFATLSEVSGSGGLDSIGHTYVPAARASMFSSGTASTTARPRPPNFGTVPVLIAVGTGVILAHRYSDRSGSWNRSSYFSGSSS